MAVNKGGLYIALAVAILAMAACARATPTPTPTPQPSPSPLELALGMAPLEFADAPVEFADYAGSRKATGLEEVRGIDDVQQIDPEKAQRLYEGLPWHELLRDYVTNVRDQVGLDIVGFDLGIWSDQLPHKARKFMVMEGPFDREEIATKLLGLDYQQDEYKGVTYYRLHKDYQVSLRHALRVLASPLNRAAFVEDRFLAAPATHIIQQLIDVQRGEAPTLLDSRPHSALAGAAGDGMLGATFLTPGWIMDRWHELRDKPFAQLEKYKTGPEPWAVLSPYTHALLGYRVRGGVQENVVALYYPDPAWAEKDAAELEKRWTSFRIEIEGAGEVFSPADKCSPFFTAVVQEADSSVLVGVCSGDPGLWMRLSFIGQPLLFLVPALEELKEGGGQ